MCGITGAIFLDRERQTDPINIKNMTDVLYHRGPDDEGFYIHQNIGLGFRRLSIIDLKAGHQPLGNENGTIQIVFNGEIYNYLEQRQILKQRGYVFKTQSDTEVILHLYQEFGTNCLEYLRGMFAFAIWDNNKQQLFCARDRFGIKPFYYYSDNEKFLFGSEIKTILACKNVDKSLSYGALDSYFAFGYITSDLSIYNEIKKLQPSHYLLLSLKGKPQIEIKKYWKLQFAPDYSKTENQWNEEIVSCFSETVKLHMISDVPLGAFLSGGIDSSSVVAMMAKNSNLPIKTFSIGFKELKFNELEYAREMSKKYGCEHHEQIVEPESLNLLPKLVRAYDEPFADSSAIPTYYVSKLARQHVTVALSGDGGDELFAGYDIYNFFKKINSLPLHFKTNSNNELLWGNINKLIPGHGKVKNALHYLTRNRKSLNAFLSIWTIEERNKLILNNSSGRFDRPSEFYKEKILLNSSIDDFISNAQFLDIQTYMVDDILTKVDRASMLNSLEVRVPILDHIFAELSFKIPSNLKLKGREQKYILKSAMSSFLSPNILNHPKQGFSIPISKWFKDDLKTYVKDTLLTSNPLLTTYLDKKYVNMIVEGNNNAMHDRSEKIWSLLFFEEWLKQNPF
jgi:asparagine synthase (glutamine-hydrolysing)